MTEGTPISEHPELQEALRQQLENPDSDQWKCPQCGCSGIHACTGSPMREWTQEEKDGLNKVLKDIYGWE